jgi:hypothetical protein
LRRSTRAALGSSQRPLSVISESADRSPLSSSFLAHRRNVMTKRPIRTLNRTATADWRGEMEFLRCKYWIIVADYRFSRLVAFGQRSRCACLMPSPKTSNEQGEFSSDGHVKVAVRQASHHPTSAQSVRLIFGEPVRPKA